MQTSLSNWVKLRRALSLLKQALNIQSCFYTNCILSSRKYFIEYFCSCTPTHPHTSFLSICFLEESRPIGQDLEGGAAEINCNGIIEVANYTENNNKGTVVLKEDLHNANDCGVQNLKQEPNFLNAQNGDCTSQDTDDCTPVASELPDPMACQSPTNVNQSFCDQDISQLQQSIRSEMPCEDDQEQNGAMDNKGTFFADQSPQSVLTACTPMFMNVYRLVGVLCQNVRAGIQTPVKL